ncbi:hypothetical protein RIE95_17200 [Acidithiobacillus thiooxidans]|uniref:hypothetical protein n=1 Tax=Acidithiobacillus thiooxidans TaxID=930 RepID=UPI002862B31E|nr:hypothetical protein [Acidithiobacillus thiooxidans]MDR7928701.1 hypothetical protein [Acidithiobacillus thiooxidans]
MCHNLLQDPKIFQWLYRVDVALAETTRNTRCACGGKWHRADYPRKPRGCLRDFRILYASRFSFCCSHCRKRRTSPSVRFFGRRVYLALVILLMAGRLTVRTPGAQAVCALLDVPGRTLRRWRDWWRQDFPMTSLWQAEVACYLPPVHREDLPHSLLVNQRHSLTIFQHQVFTTPYCEI